MKFVFFIFLFIFIHCKSVLKPNLLEDSEKWDHIVNDKKFLTEFNGNGVYYLDNNSEFVEIEDLSSLDFTQKNRYAIQSLKQGEIDLAEKIWKDRLLESPEDSLALLNFIRLSYLVGDYENIRIHLANVFQKKSPTKDYVFTVLNWLKKDMRIEESILFLDVLSNRSEFELQALEEIGNYFLQINDLPRARTYFEKILSIFAFHEGALAGMVKVNFYEEKWEDAIVFGRTAQKIKANTDYRPYLLQAYYESGEYEEGLKLVKETPAKFKQQKLFLRAWISIHYSLHPNQFPNEIQPFLNSLHTEEKKELLYFVSPECKHISKRIFQGM
jgi:tetratricopeptide (TPR) repeat protein